MYVVHPEHMIGRSQDNLGTLGQDHRLKHINHLGDIGHFKPGGVLVEYVQCQCGDHGVPHRVLLEKMAGIRAGFNIEPCAPFVKKQVDPVIRVVEIHDRLMVFDNLVDFYGLAKDIVIVLISEFSG